MSFVACTKCRDDPSTFRNNKTVLTPEWLPPRGWAGTLNMGPRDIVIVSLNPGAPMRGELAVYAQAGLPAGSLHPPKTVTSAQANVVTEHCTGVYFSNDRSRDHVFHKKSVGYARALLTLLDGRDPGTQAVRERCWFTDIFKCSTPEELAPTISNGAFVACRRHIDHEIELLSPKAIVALGGTAKRCLATQYGQRLVSFRHPSNGCPRLDAEAHDKAFVQAAKLFNVSTDPRSSAFRRMRQAIHASLFP